MSASASIQRVIMPRMIAESSTTITCSGSPCADVEDVAAARSIPISLPIAVEDSLKFRRKEAARQPVERSY
jgi:hypothetical protein